MFTKEDYREYFNTIEDKEKGMVDHLKKMKEAVKDRVVIDAIDLVLKDEIMHVKLAGKLLEYVR